MKEFDDLRKYLFEIHVPSRNDWRFHGNASLVLFPGDQTGSGFIASADHVVTRAADTKIAISRNGHKAVVNQHDHHDFRWSEGRDLALMPVDEIRGIPIAQFANLTEPHYILGSRHGKLHCIEVFINAIDGVPVSKLDSPQQTCLLGERIAYQTTVSEPQFIPGTSGSVVIDSEGFAIGIHTNSYRHGPKRGIEGYGYLFHCGY